MIQQFYFWVYIQRKWKQDIKERGVGGSAWVMGWKSCEIGLLSLCNYRCDKFI